jgi:TonB family protein
VSRYEAGAHGELIRALAASNVAVDAPSDERLMRVTKERRRRGIAVSIAMAVAVHLLVILPLVHGLLPDPDGRDFSYQMAPIRPYQLVLERAAEQEQEPRQIVSIDAPASERPDEARFEDRVNRRVEEETAARQRGQPAEETLREPSRAQPEQPRRQRERRQEREARRERPVEDDVEPVDREEQRRPVEDELAAVFEPSERGQEPTRRSRVEDPNRPDQAESRDDSRLDLSAFAPSMETASQYVAVPGAPSADFLDLPQGARDQLNSYENMYWSYWDRIKNQVRPHWRPSSVYRDRDPTGRVFGVEDRYTVLRVTLNGDGSLRHVYLERSSDLDFLDREAIRAVRAAEPFANVPEGLKDERGLLSFRFGFYFEVSSSSFRIRREDW